MQANTTLPPGSPLPFPLPFKVDVDSTLGMEFIVLILAAIFYGITLLQTIYYYRHYPDDSSRMKTLVAIAWVLDTLGLVLIIYGLYNYLITNFGNPLAVHGLIWSTSAESIVTALIVVIVNSFLFSRILTLGDRKPAWKFFVAGMGVWQAFLFSLSILNVSNTANSSSLAAAEKTSRWVTITTSINESAIDVVITVSICYLLYKSRSGLHRTDRLINRLTTYIVTSGSITATLMLTLMISYLAAPNNLFYGLINITLPHAYVNAFLATLNSRNAMKGNTNTGATTNTIPSFRIHSHFSSRTATEGVLNDQDISLSGLESAHGQNHKQKPMDC